jgi:hypothetical protein
LTFLVSHVRLSYELTISKHGSFQGLTLRRELLYIAKYEDRLLALSFGRRRVSDLGSHTDEIPIVLGFVLIASALLAVVFPRRFIISAAIIGVCLFVAETLVHYSALHAPYSAGTDLPWMALVGYVPAVLGTAFGVGVRRSIAG